MASSAALAPPETELPSEQQPSAPPKVSARDYNERLGLIYPIRQLGPIVGGGLTGLVMGGIYGSNTAGLRFRAENAHRLPTTHKGWYLYHKSKNYASMWGGLKEGARMSLKIGFWAGSFCAVEELVDNWRRGSKDVLSTVISGVSCAGAYSAWNRFPLPTTAKTVRMSLLASLGWGFLQDMQGLMRGREVGYVTFVKRRVFGIEKAEAVDTKLVS